MGKRIDLTGRRFGRLVVVSEAGREPGGGIRWTCRCDCGAQKAAYGGDLRSGKTKSCGCLKRESQVPLTLTHGQSRTPLYRRWWGALQRTTNPNQPAFRHYGGRGITVCERWQTFENFAADMGPTFQPTLTLERIDVNGNYEPSNCRWATWTEQARNRRNNRFLTFRGHTKTVMEWCELLGLKHTTVTQRLDRRGWPIERALTTGANPEALSRLTEADDDA